MPDASFPAYILTPDRAKKAMRDIASAAEDYYQSSKYITKKNPKDISDVWEEAQRWVNEEIRWDRNSNLCGDYDHKYLKEFVDRVDIADIANYLESKNISINDYIDCGHHGIVLEGYFNDEPIAKPLAIRISQSDDTNFRGDLTREEETVYVLQPYFSSSREGQKLNSCKIEVMPKLLMLTDLVNHDVVHPVYADKLIEVFASNLPKGYFVNDNEREEYGVLPDGTLIAVDPNAIRSKYTTPDSTMYYHQNINNNNLEELEKATGEKFPSFNLYTNDGIAKQVAFFGHDKYSQNVNDYGSKKLVFSRDKPKTPSHDISDAAECSHPERTKRWRNEIKSGEASLERFL